MPKSLLKAISQYLADTPHLHSLRRHPVPSSSTSKEETSHRQTTLARCPPKGAQSSRNKGATISRNWGATSFRNQGADCLGICILSAENKRQLWIPEGFAHGFLTLSDHAEFVYKTTNYYARESDRGICWNDPQIAIDWKLHDQPILSSKDQFQPCLTDAECFE
ncbi:dTDP-4-dehydrorhamnose 3,5-epimerase family protein [Rhizobium miluonense]|uniref:dTDP-4-dehydrorhamnose 3,5-epimerase family protein n=1 Tax=Rhizobium miluonense TaxID=411945 RepID=UPI000B86E6A7